MTKEIEESFESNPIVTLCISNVSGVVHLTQVGGYTLSILLKELATIEDIPVAAQSLQKDYVGQEIFIITDYNFFKTITGTFTHMSYKSIKEIPSFDEDSSVYSFVVSY